jgi:hypothetical protein
LNIDQIAILIFSCSSIWALSSKRYFLGFILGLCGQPFWIYSSLTAGQYGIFLVSLWFTGNHIKGIINHRRIE